MKVTTKQASVELGTTEQSLHKVIKANPTKHGFGMQYYEDKGIIRNNKI